MHYLPLLVKIFFMLDSLFSDVIIYMNPRSGVNLGHVHVGSHMQLLNYANFNYIVTIN